MFVGLLNFYGYIKGLSVHKFYKLLEIIQQIQYHLKAFFKFDFRHSFESIGVNKPKLIKEIIK